MFQSHFSFRKLLLFLTLSLSLSAFSQGFLHRDGKYIYDGQNHEFIIKSIGTGNWLLQEGYMMRSANVAGTQHEFTQKLVETIGQENTDIFYDTWLNNHFTRTDVDSMKVWGFNAVRVAMHYKWMTLSIQEEPVVGQDTWIESGFVRLDSLLSWCADNEMYLILDLHAAPGGQGYDANISDYDPTKPSLWESSENRRKTVALWKKLAERYADEPWIGGYDLINEPNWDLPNGSLLRQLYGQITTAIREVDQNHIIFIEGNWFANDFTGLTPPWDDNMVYSFHKYWNYNDQNSISWVISLRNAHNIPIWLGESGENSNTWFTNAIKLCETNKIGWSWWPVKKAGVNNVLEVTANQSYDDLISYWENGSPQITEQQAFDAVMEWADRHKIENCKVKYDVIDAMMRQPSSTETLPKVVYRPYEKIKAVDYNYGRNGYAYYDVDTCNHQLSTGSYSDWNRGWAYRSDGVDIEKCMDVYPNQMDYSVGWIETGEWMEYTVAADTTAAYSFDIRSASGDDGSKLHVEIDGVDATGLIQLPSTGGWQSWQTKTFEGIILPAGVHKMKLYFDEGGSNLSYVRFYNASSTSQLAFHAVSAQTSSDGTKILISLNKNVTTMEAVSSDFTLTVNGNPAAISTIAVSENSSREITIGCQVPIQYGQTVKVSYSGQNIMSNEQQLGVFNQLTVANRLPFRHVLPATIQAEDFNFNNGFELETCTDVGGGQNVGFANQGDYLDYKIVVPETGEYIIDFRVASAYSNGKVDIRIGDNDTFTSLGSISFASTGGWQQWRNQAKTIPLEQGYFTLRLYSMAGEYNLNWFSVSKANGEGELKKTGFFVNPNPSNGIFSVSTFESLNEATTIQIIDLQGKVLLSKEVDPFHLQNEPFDVSYLPKGIYLLQLKNQGIQFNERLILH